MKSFFIAISGGKNDPNDTRLQAKRTESAVFHK
jgi:hypothetical protein